MPKLEIDDEEAKIIEQAMWDLYDRHKGDGNKDKAKEFKKIYEKIHSQH